MKIKNKYKWLLIVLIPMIALVFFETKTIGAIHGKETTAETSAVDSEAGVLDLEKYTPVEELEKKRQKQTRAFPPETRLGVQVDPGTVLAETLIGEGVEISNLQYSGATEALGTFKNGQHALQIDEGIILSTGKIVDIPGPNALPNATTAFYTPGDVDLHNMTDIRNMDAVVLEFDFVPAGRRLVFDYVFASEEYPSYVGSDYNDAFAFFLDGKNIAKLPGSNMEVTINNVNHIMNTEYFRENFYSAALGSPINIEFNGLTTLLNIGTAVTPGKKHHMKLVIADTDDAAFDSAVFFGANSFSSKYEVSYEGGPGSVGTPPPSEEVTLFGEHIIEEPTNLSKPGHNFLGWRSSLTNTLYQPGDILKVEDMTVLTAEWSQRTYKVNYDLNMGEGTKPPETEHNEDSQVTIMDDSFTNRPGYYFTGWKSSVDGTIYQPGDTFKISSNTTLTAQWLGTPVVDPVLKISPNEIKQTKRTTFTSTFVNEAPLPTKWTNVKYQTTAFPEGVVPDISTLKVNNSPHTGTANYDSVSRILTLVLPDVSEETIITYEAEAAVDAKIQTVTMTYSLKGEEEKSQTVSNEATLKVTPNTVTMTVKYVLEDGVTPVKNIDTGLPIAEDTISGLEVGAPFNAEDYKKDIKGFDYQAVETTATTTVPETAFTVLVKYKGYLCLTKVTEKVDFGTNQLIVLGTKDIRPLEPITVNIMDSRESNVDWTLSLHLEDTFKNKKGDAFKGEVRFKDKQNNDVEIDTVKKVVQTREENKLGETAITWNKDTEGLYLQQSPGNYKDSYDGKLIWTLTDGL